MNYWKIYCMEDQWPGLWLRWFRAQAFAVGWPASWGYHLRGKTKQGKGSWGSARRTLEKMSVGDRVVVQLKGHRIGRVGEIVSKAVEDDEWAPLVLPSKSLPDGEMGRRVLVRWDLQNGPVDPELVVHLPESARLAGYARGALRPLTSTVFSRIEDAASNRENWVGLLGHKFGKERALSDYIAAYPHRLEEGLTPFPDARTRENVFPDGTRSDVLLIDTDENPVVVECKQHAASPADVRQLRGYMRNVKRETGLAARGLLVHGGSTKLSGDVRKAAEKSPEVEVVSYRLAVDFTASR